MNLFRKINAHGFTLFELMLSMTIFASMMVLVFDAVANIGIARTKSMSRITLIEELYFFSEKLTSAIKDGGIVDYEEYWNRTAVGVLTSTGHYRTPTGFGNYGSGGVIGTDAYGNNYYYCLSTGSTVRMGTGGCLTAYNGDFTGNNRDQNYSGSYQRYGQYKLQYTDYNGNNDTDMGDEDNNTDIRGDEDDLDIGNGPLVITGAIPELYLYNPLTKERTYFRWTYMDDPGLPVNTCNYTTGSGCLGNIEILKLKGIDIGMGHTGTTSSGSFDGEIDTWICHPDWRCNGAIIPASVGGGTLPTGNDNEWIKMFPEYVSVRKLSFTIYPLKDPWKSWAVLDDLTTPGFISSLIQPYVKIQMQLGLAWEKRRLIRGDDPTISISTTISLSSNDIQ